VVRNLRTRLHSGWKNGAVYLRTIEARGAEAGGNTDSEHWILQVPRTKCQAVVLRRQ